MVIVEPEVGGLTGAIAGMSTGDCSLPLEQAAYSGLSEPQYFGPTSPSYPQWTPSEAASGVGARQRSSTVRTITKQNDLFTFLPLIFQAWQNARVCQTDSYGVPVTVGVIVAVGVTVPSASPSA